MRRITLTQNKVTIIDDEDYKVIKGMGSWMYSSAGYAWRWDRWDNTTKSRKPIYMHRFLMKPPEGMVVDHINGNPLDNRKSNLRICTGKQNRHNNKIPATNTTGYHNVQFMKKTGKYRVLMKYNGVGIYLGMYDTPKEAALIRDAYVRKNFDGFPRLNFPIT